MLLCLEKKFNWPLQIKKGSEDGKEIIYDLLNQILINEPEKRIGVEEIKYHHYFMKVKVMQSIKINQFK